MKESAIMSNRTTNDRITGWRECLAKLPWTTKHVKQSATIALSKAEWLGIDKEQAVQQIFELALGRFFEANPQIPFQALQTVSQQNFGSDQDRNGLMEFATAAAFNS
jgi:hypothetical protein